MKIDQFLEKKLFKNLSSDVDVDHIRPQWKALSPPYDIEKWVLPLPVWAKRKYDLSPLDSWKELNLELQLIGQHKPFCIYIHIPFCSTKCGFCDSYSFKLGAHKEERILEYVDQLCDELKLWSEQGNLRYRPVSTIHLGGGTPNFIGESALTKIVECCKSNFNIYPQTEWALEATVESLTPGMIGVMDELGFRRLHIGVQSLEEKVRKAIGRRKPTIDVLEKIHHTLDLGWIVSVDMVCGLPYQRLDTFVSDLKTLSDAGVNGISLYELLIYPQNKRWAEKHKLIDRSHLHNYLTFQAGAHILEKFGFKKNLFNHWADERDKNIYFTFPTRGEDCLAIGAIADGVFGDLHYRHPKYAPYLRNASAGFPGLEGGLRRNELENILHPLITELLSGWINSEILPKFCVPAADNSGSLLEQWQKSCLIEDIPDKGFRLTTNGSWFVGNMIAELTMQYKKLG